MFEGWKVNLGHFSRRFGHFANLLTQFAAQLNFVRDEDQTNMVMVMGEMTLRLERDREILQVWGEIGKWGRERSEDDHHDHEDDDHGDEDDCDISFDNPLDKLGDCDDVLDVKFQGHLGGWISLEAWLGWPSTPLTGDDDDAYDDYDDYNDDDDEGDQVHRWQVSLKILVPLSLQCIVLIIIANIIVVNIPIIILILPV